MKYFLIGTITIILTVALAVALGVFAPQILDMWILAPFGVGVILLGTGFYINRPSAHIK